MAGKLQVTSGLHAHLQSLRRPFLKTVVGNDPNFSQASHGFSPSSLKVCGPNPLAGWQHGLALCPRYSRHSVKGAEWVNGWVACWNSRSADSCLCMCAESLQSCLNLCNSMDCSPPASYVHRILQARILEWVVISSSRGSPWPRDWTRVSCIGRWVLYH